MAPYIQKWFGCNEDFPVQTLSGAVTFFDIPEFNIAGIVITSVTTELDQPIISYGNDLHIRV